MSQNLAREAKPDAPAENRVTRSKQPRRQFYRDEPRRIQNGPENHRAQKEPGGYTQKPTDQTPKERKAQCLREENRVHGWKPDYGGSRPVRPEPKSSDQSRQSGYQYDA